MPRPWHAQGRPGSRVIPDDWNQAHAPVVEKAMRGRCELREPGAVQSWSDAEQQMVSVPHSPYYDDACRAQALVGKARVVHVADDREVLADYLVVVPLDVGAAEEHLVTVHETGDPSLDGLTLQVLHAVRGTERWERDLFCVLQT